MIRNRWPTLGPGALLALAFALPTPTRGGDLLGADACRTCHEAEYQQWRQTSHAEALTRLSATQQRDRSCRSCHTLEPLSDDAALAGVQCESCHGPGRQYSPSYVMKDKTLAQLLDLAEVNEATCAGCHAGSSPSVLPWNYAEKIELVRHRPKGAAPESR